MPTAFMPQNMDMSSAAPSTMAASDDLALARALRLEQRREHAEGEQHAAAAEVADQVERRSGGSPLRPIPSSAPASAM